MASAGNLTYEIQTSGLDSLTKVVKSLGNIDNKLRVTNKSGKALTKVMGDMEKAGQSVATFLKVGLGAAGVYGFGQLLDSANQTREKLKAVSFTTGIAQGALESFGKAAQVANSSLSFSGALGELSGLQEKINQIKMGKGNVSPFMQLGIDPTQTDAIGVMKQLASVINDINPAFRGSILSQLGISSEMATSLKEITSNLGAFGNRLTVVDKTGVEKLSKNLRKLKLAGVELGQSFVAKVSPALTIVLEKLLSYISTNRDGINSFFTKVGEIATFFAGRLVSAGGAVNTLVEKFGGLETALNTLKIAFAATWIKKLVSPFFLLLLVLDDLVSYFSGEGSVTGEIVAWFKHVKDHGTGVEKIITGVVTALGALAAVKFFGIASGLASVGSALLSPAGAVIAGLAVAGLATHDIYKSATGRKDEAVTPKLYQYFKSAITGEKSTSPTMGGSSSINNNTPVKITNHNNVTVSSAKEAGEFVTNVGSQMPNIEKNIMSLTPNLQ